jgi:hypothetical protein
MKEIDCRWNVIEACDGIRQPEPLPHPGAPPFEGLPRMGDCHLGRMRIASDRVPNCATPVLWDSETRSDHLMVEPSPQ